MDLRNAMLCQASAKSTQKLTSLLRVRSEPFSINHRTENLAKMVWIITRKNDANWMGQEWSKQKPQSGKSETTAY